MRYSKHDSCIRKDPVTDSIWVRDEIRDISVQLLVTHLGRRIHNVLCSGVSIPFREAHYSVGIGLSGDDIPLGEYMNTKYGEQIAAEIDRIESRREELECFDPVALGC